MATRKYTYSHFEFLVEVADMLVWIQSIYQNAFEKEGKQTEALPLYLRSVNITPQSNIGHSSHNTFRLQLQSARN